MMETVKYYRKKPVCVQAIKYTENNREEAFRFALPECSDDAVNGFMRMNLPLVIETPEGDMNVSYGDYIIKGVKGEFYPCKPDIFEATYDEVNFPKYLKEQPMHKTRIEEIKARCEAASPGPWSREKLGFAVKSSDAKLNIGISMGNSTSTSSETLRLFMANLDFISQSREDIPFLLEHIERLEAENMWIPVSQARPRICTHVNVCLEHDGNKVVTGAYFNVDSQWTSGGMLLTAIYHGGIVIGWKPLPQPPADKGA